MTFHGRYRGQDASHDHGHDDHHAPALSEVHESPMTMLAPLAVLAAGAAVAGILFAPQFIGEQGAAFWHGAVAAIAGNGLGPQLEKFPMWVELAPFALTVIGFGVAYYYYILNPELPAQMAAKKGLLYTFLYDKWYFDELYDFLLVQPAKKFGRFLWKFGDGTVIDGLGPDGIAARVLDATRGAVRLQSGYVYHYAFAMLIGVVALATWFMLAGGAP
jgi:NADH-quinone oxidoreductase subunit L